MSDFRLSGETRRVLGIDASLRATGVGVVEAAGSQLRAIAHGVLRNPAARPLSACLVFLQDELARWIETHTPDAVAVEGIFFAKNVRTMLTLAHARGALIAQCARLGLPVYAYEPRRVKLAVTGHGGAQKEQVQKMIRTLLGLDADPPHDAADALALAIAHLHSRRAILADSASAPI